MRLTGKTALITGATRGVGAAIARTFASEGARVAVLGRSQERGKAVVHDIESSGGFAHFIACDVGVEDQVRSAVEEAVTVLGGLTTLVNNAAGTTQTVEMGARELRTHEVTTAEFDDMMKSTAYSTFWCSKYAIPTMIDAGEGSIINISSLISFAAQPFMSSYSAAKGAVNSLTRAMAADYSRYGIRVNNIPLGFVTTPVTQDAADDTNVITAIRNAQLTRIGQPEDIAALAVYLASDESAYCSGTTIHLDGGLHAKSPLPSSEIMTRIQA